MKYQDYISEWLVYGKHNKKSACDCVACRMQRELEVANPVFYTAAALAKAREEGRRELANEIKAAAKLNPAGEEFWSETRDVYIIGARALDALLGAKEAGE